MAANHELDHLSPYRADGKLYGFICVVTGTEGPLGAAIASELAAHGAAGIYCCSGDSTRPLAARLSKDHPNTKIVDYPLKAEDEQDTLTLIDDILNVWGRLDVWVAGGTLLGPASMSETSPADLRRCFEANSIAPFLAMKYAAPAMTKLCSKGSYPRAAPKEQTYGSIIVVTSVASTTGGCWGPCFTMSSHAALGVVRSGVASLKGTGVRINALSPGEIDIGVSLKDLDVRGMSSQLPPATLQDPNMQKSIIGLERSGRPDEVARVVGFLASGFSSYVTGANIVVDGGCTTMNPLTVPI